MKKLLSRALITALLICTSAICLSFNASAASASLWFTDPSATVGNNVSVTVDVRGDNIGGYQMSVAYDTSYLRFVSASGNTNYFSGVDNGGVIRVSDMTNSGSTSRMSFTLTFKTQKTGKTKLTPSDYRFFDGGGDPITPGAIGDSTININAVPEASSDATLKSLAISSGTLTPAFSSATTEYTAAVDFDVTSMTVTAVKNHNGATVYVGGNDSLAVGQNRIVVTVTAENGATKTYTITVTRAKNPLSTDITVSFDDGRTAEVSSSFESEKIPRGFTSAKLTINGKDVDSIFYDENAKPAVYLLGNENVEEGFYFIDVATLNVKPFEYLGQASVSLTVLDINLAPIPDGYEIGKFTVGGVERDALVPSTDSSETPNHCLVYAIGASGEKTLYLYDPIENSYQRYGFAEVGEAANTVPDEPTNPVGTEKPAPETEKQPQENNQNANNSLFANKVFMWSFIAIAVLIAALVGVAIVLNVKNN